DLVREEKVDLVHAHLAYSAIWSALLSRRTGIPSVVSLHASPAATKSLAPGLVHGVKVEIKDRLMRFVVNRWSRRDAVERVAGMHFLIVGDGPKRAEWQAMTTSDRVHWAGYRTDVDAILAGCDLFVHPSLDDAFPTVLLEAMAAGLPVVASNVGGIPEIVATPPSVRTGILVPPGDPAAFANAIRNIAPSMGIAGRERAEREFSIEAWMARLERVYAEALA
ncbi:MAG: glycosyltransferase family 4 protein, partial [Thermoanaerobaculia bacterium]